MILVIKNHKSHKKDRTLIYKMRYKHMNLWYNNTVKKSKNFEASYLPILKIDFRAKKSENAQNVHETVL